MSRQVIAYTDGSAYNNPNGAAGWAWFVSPESWGAGGFPKASNQVAEMFAILAVLRAVPGSFALLIRTDSEFCVKTLSGWMAGWKRNGWKKKDGGEPANLSLLKELDRALEGRSVTFEWVRGHNGNRGNEIADKICGAASLAMKGNKPVARGPGWNGPLAPKTGDVPVVPQRAGGRTIIAVDPRTGKRATMKMPTVDSRQGTAASYCNSCDAPINPYSFECLCSN